MDNPQHYQPLSHALHPPTASAQSRSPYDPAPVYTPPPQHATIPTQRVQPTGHREEEEEEEEDHEDDDDSGMVDKPLTNSNHRDAGEHNTANNLHLQPSPLQRNNDLNALESVQQNPTLQVIQQGHPGEQKRRPGRPRGSKNRKLRAPPASKDIPNTPVAPSGPPPHPDINPANQKYYEFQWRILNLCSEFYGAADELIRTTDPLVIAQCYHLGVPSKVDPIMLLSDGKRTCDALLANPVQLLINPPPPIYPILPTFFAPTGPTSAAPGAAPSPSAPGSSKPLAPSAPAPAPVITNAQSFVVPLSLSTSSAASAFATSQYSMYPPPQPHGQYPTTSYYQLPFAHHAYYAPPPGATTGPGAASTSISATQATTPQPSSSTATQPSGGARSASVSAPPTNSGGPWLEDEIEKLKKVAEESKAASVTGEVDWDHVVRTFGDSRTRHQILIKATSLGLKESSTARGVKRRREHDSSSNAGPAPPGPGPPGDMLMGSLSDPKQQPPAAMQGIIDAPPAHRQASSTPGASPALQNLQRPGSSASTSAQAASSANNQQQQQSKPPSQTQQSQPTSSSAPSSSLWPMPITAATNNAAVTSATQEPQRTSYYRPRPTGEPAYQQPRAAEHPRADSALGAGGRGAVSAAQQLHHYTMYSPPNGRTRDG